MLLQMQINRLLTIMFCVLGPRLPRNFSPLLSRRYRSNQFKLHFLEACRTQQNLVCRENYFLAMVFPGVWFQVCSLAAKVGLDFLTCWIGTYTLTFNDRITDFWILFTYELKVFWQKLHRKSWQEKWLFLQQYSLEIIVVLRVLPCVEGLA